MRRPYLRLAAACAFAVAMTAFTGSALAGNGNGNDSAPGQVKQEQSVSTQTPAQSTAQSPQQQSAQPQSGHEPPGQAKKQQPTTAAPSAQSSSSTQAGVKPDSSTTKWTHCTTGNSSGGATCTSSDNGHTPQPNADASKRYGNGKTAAQIAVSRGGIGVQLTGPGNSQPHKVTVCGKPNNKSGGVDVHAVKRYSNPSCSETQTSAVAAAAPCGDAVAATASEKGKSEGLSHNKHETSAQSCKSAATTQSCGTASTCSNSQAVHATVAPATPAASPVVQASPVTQSSPAAPVTRSAGGVLGAQITLTPPRPAHHGVLGAVTRLSGSTLPFTGFPIWVAVVIALALIFAGLVLRRRGAATRL
jgi:hypothetical protein